jgi:renalase
MRSSHEYIMYKHTVVIGAGISGLVAASKLAASGVEVAVFEKARGTGGRMGSKRVEVNSDEGSNPKNSITFDLGASSFQSLNQEFVSFLDLLDDSGVVSVNSHNRYIGSPRNSMLTRHLSKKLNVSFGQKITRIENKEGQWYLFALTQQSNRQPQSVNIKGQLPSSDVVRPCSEVLIATCQQLVLAMPAEQVSELLGSDHEAYEHVCNIKSEPSFVATFVVQNLSAEEIKHLAVYSDSVIAEVSLEHEKVQRESHGFTVLKLTTTSKWASVHIDEGNDRAGELLLQRFKMLVNEPNANVVKQYTHRWLYSEYSQLIPAAYLSFQDNLHIVGDYFNPSHAIKPDQAIVPIVMPLAEGVERAFLSASQLTKKLLHDRLVNMSSEDSLEAVE